jgi:hypothetical protein
VPAWRLDLMAAVVNHRHRGHRGTQS